MFDQLSRDIVVFFRAFFMEKRTKVDSVSVGNILKLRERFELRVAYWAELAKDFVYKNTKYKGFGFFPTDQPLTSSSSYEERHS